MCRRPEVLDKLAKPKDLAGQAELFLDSFQRLDEGNGLVGAEVVPSEESCNILDRPEKLIAAG